MASFYGHNHGLRSAYIWVMRYYMTCIIIFMLSLYTYAQPQLTALLLNNACTKSVYMLQGKTAVSV